MRSARKEGGLRQNTNGEQAVCHQRQGAKASKRRSLSSLKAECDKLAHKWLAQGNDPTKETGRTIVQQTCWNGGETMSRQTLKLQIWRGVACVHEHRVQHRSEPSPKWSLISEQEEAAANGRPCGRH